MAVLAVLWITQAAGTADDRPSEAAATAPPAEAQGGWLTAGKGPLPVLPPPRSPDHTTTRPLDPPPWASQSIVKWQPANGSIHISAGAGRRRSGAQPLPLPREPGAVLSLTSDPGNPLDIKTILESLSYYLGFGLKHSWFRSQWTLKADLGAIVQGDNTSPGSARNISSPDATSLPVAIYPVIFIGITRQF